MLFTNIQKRYDCYIFGVYINSFNNSSVKTEMQYLFMWFILVWQKLPESDLNTFCQAKLHIQTGIAFSFAKTMFEFWILSKSIDKVYFFYIMDLVRNTIQKGGDKAYLSNEIYHNEIKDFVTYISCSAG